MSSCLKVLVVGGVLLVSQAHAGPTGGDIDVSFSGTGYEVLKFASGESSGYAEDVLVDSAGRIYLIGSPNVDGTRRFAIARYSAEGNLDKSFNGTGKVVTEASVGNITATAATFDRQGKLLVAGYKRLSATNHDFFVCRFDTTGSMLPLAGSNNACARPAIDADTDFPVEQAFAIAVDAQNRIVLAGEAFGAGGKVFGAVVRMNPNGSLDSNFDGGPDNQGAGNGIVLLRTAPELHFDTFNAVDIGPDGNIYVVGTGTKSVDIPNRRVITVNKLSGASGTSFLTFASRTHDVTVNGRNEGNTLAFDRNGDLVIGGATGFDGVVLKVSRVTGAAVPAFNNTGIRLLTSGDRFAVKDLAVTHDNEIIAVGTYTKTLGQGQDILAVRVRSNGTLVGGFGVNGLRTIDMFEIGEDDTAAAIALTPNREKPVIAGYFFNSPTFTGQTATLTRLTSDVIFFDTYERN